MSQTMWYQALPPGVIGFVETHPDILELFGSLAEFWRMDIPARPLLRDIRQLLREAEEDASILRDYGRLTLPTLRAFAASSPLRAVLPTLTQFYLDAAGPGIHFLLTGTAEGGGEPPLRNLIYGGKELPVVYPSRRLLTPPQVLEIAQALAAVDVGSLKDRYDADRMNALNIYPWDWPEDSTALDWLLKHHDALAAYVQQAADRHHALVMSTTV